MTTVLSHSLRLDHEDVIGLGESIYVLEEEIDYHEVMKDFEEFLTYYKPEDLFTHGSLILKFFESIRDYLELDQEGQQMVNGFFIEEGYPLTVDFIRSRQRLLQHFNAEWLDRFGLASDRFIDFSLRWDEVEAINPLKTTPSTVVITTPYGAYQLEYPTDYKGPFLLNQVYLKTAYYQPYIQALTQLFND